jgi:hypothetical protein
MVIYNHPFGELFKDKHNIHQLYLSRGKLKNGGGAPNLFARPWSFPFQTAAS